MRTLDRLKILYEERYREHHDIDAWNEAIEKEWPKILAVVEAAEIMREDLEGVDWLSPGAKAYDKAKAEL